VWEEEAQRVQEAVNVVSEMPATVMLPNRVAVAVIPGSKKAAFGFGARWGRGLLTMRDEHGYWLPPSFIRITGGNFGFQAGVQSTDLVLIFTNERAINSLLRGRFTLNADAAYALGTFGQKFQVGTPVPFSSGILSRSRSKWLYGGVSLDGTAITVDNRSNARVYGKNISGRDILLAQRVETNSVVDPFLSAMEKVSPSFRSRQARAQAQCEAQAQAQAQASHQ
jgi:lipid-binding SYLF domain-containing protein